MKYWTATCSECGGVKVMQKTKPTTCKELIRSGIRSSRICGKTLTDQDNVTKQFLAMRGFRSSSRPQLETILDTRAMAVAVEVARKRWPGVQLTYVGTDRETFQHYFQEWANPKPFVLGD